MMMFRPRTHPRRRVYYRSVLRAALLLGFVFLWADVWHVVALRRRAASVSTSMEIPPRENGNIVLDDSFETTNSYQDEDDDDDVEDEKGAKNAEITDIVNDRDKIFISAIHWNSEAMLREGGWMDALLNLTLELGGAEHVYVSVYESGSWDGTKAALRELDARLAELDVPRSIVLDGKTHLDEILAQDGAPKDDVGREGWIKLPPGTSHADPRLKPGTWAKRRIPYLSELRNRSLRPLLTQLEANVTKYDKILFLNDVVFTPGDMHTLLATRDGEYAAACTLDFAHPPAYYDTFALRDMHGHPPATSTWPFFRDAHAVDAMLAQVPVRVGSCWNGAVAMDAAPFYPAKSSQDVRVGSVGSTLGLTFRGVPDSLARHHVEGSECCLIHADNPLSNTAHKGVWVNPRVRVGYSRAAYDAVHAHTNTNSPSSSSAAWPASLRRTLFGLWRNRLARWLATATSSPQQREMLRRVERWKAEQKERNGKLFLEPGVMCLIGEMQVLRENGWAHIDAKH